MTKRAMTRQPESRSPDERGVMYYYDSNEKTKDFVLTRE